MASLVLVGGLLLTSLSLCDTRSFEILLPQPTHAGGLVLAPGQYRVTVEGSDAVFQEVRSARSFRTAVKVEVSGATYPVTRIRVSKNAGAERMDAIELEGSGTRLEFE